MAVRDIYTEADFGSMGWHDCHIHAVAFEPLPSEPGRPGAGVEQGPAAVRRGARRAQLHRAGIQRYSDLRAGPAGDRPAARAGRTARRFAATSTPAPRSAITPAGTTTTPTTPRFAANARQIA